MSLNNQLEGFATLAAPAIQIYNINAAPVSPATPFACQFNTTNSSQIVRLRIVNSGSGTVSIMLGPSVGGTASAPNVTSATTTQTGGTATFASNAQVTSAATALAAGDGIRMLGNSVLEINVTGSTKVWVQANAASTPVQVAGIIQNG